MGLTVGIDIGTEKTIIASAIIDGGNCSLVRTKMVATQGFANGVITDEYLFRSNLSTLVDYAVEGKDVDELNVSFSGRYIIRDSKNSLSIQREVCENDVLQLLKSSRSKMGEKGDYVIEIEPIVYTLDMEKTRLPIGKKCKDFTMRYYAYLCSNPLLIKSLNNIFQSLNFVEEERIKFFAPVEAYRSLWAEGRHGRFGVVDMGASHIDIMLFSEGVLEMNTVLPLGADTIENDLMTAFALEDKKAVCKLKKEEGTALRSSVKSEKIVINAPKAKSFERRDFAKVIQMRMEELLEGVIYQFQQCGYDSAGAPVIFTGGGSRLREAATLFEKISGYKVELPLVSGVGNATSNTLKHPCCSLVFGLLFCGKPQEPAEERNSSKFSRMIERIFM